MNHWMLRTMLVLILTVMPLAASAQMGSEDSEKGGMMGGEGMGMPGMMEMHPMGDGGMGPGMNMMKSIGRLDLTADQKKKVQRLKLQHQKEAIPLLSKVRMAGVESQELLMADPVDMEKVKAKVKEKYGALTELEISHLTLMQQVKGLLTAEQRQQLESSMMEMGPKMRSQPGPDKPKGPPKATDERGH